MIEFFASVSPDSSGMGEGETFLGRDTILLDGTGSGTFAWTAFQLSSAGIYVSATATIITMDNTGCFSNAVLTTPIGIDASLASHLSVFPNPVLGGAINLLTPSSVTQVEVHSLTGAKAFKAQWIAGRYSPRVSLENLPAGVYLLHVTTETGRFTERLMKL